MGHGYPSHTIQIKNLYQINQKIERYEKKIVLSVQFPFFMLKLFISFLENKFHRHAQKIPLVFLSGFCLLP
jgi:hypothetical protein